MNQIRYTNKLKQTIKSQELTKQMYPEFTNVANQIIIRLTQELITLDHFKRITKRRRNVLCRKVLDNR